MPPFTTLEARAGYWQDRKRLWLNLGLEGEVRGGIESTAGRDGNLLGMSEQSRDAGYYARRREWEADEDLRRLTAEAAGQEFVPGEPPEPDPSKAIGGLRSEAGRGDRLLSAATPRAGFGAGDVGGSREQRLRYWVDRGMTAEEAEAHIDAQDLASGARYDLGAGQNAWGGSGTSIFDPVLCELCYRWFSPPGGSVLDPFAGGSVRGIVAAWLGRAYVGVDLRPEQVAANEEQRAAICGDVAEAAQPRWVCGDSRELAELAPGAYDFVFSCPPYHDLEQYSDDPRDLSNAGSYPKFKAAMQEIVSQALELLRPDRFACFVVGEVRGKSGSYVGLVPDTVNAFRMAGAELYNEAILITSVGSLPIRTSRIFPAGRKLGKAHQNVLIFCKGDPRAASEACGPLRDIAIDYAGTYVEPQEV